MITKADKTNKSSQEIENLSFDADFNMQAREMLGYDADADALVRIATDANGLLKVDPTALDSRYVNVTGDTMTGPLVIDGTSNSIQLVVQAHSTQTADLQEWQKSDGSVLVKVLGTGQISQEVSLPTGTQVATNVTAYGFTGQLGYGMRLREFPSSGGSGYGVTGEIWGGNSNWTSGRGMLGTVNINGTGTLTTGIGIYSSLSVLNTKSGGITSAYGVYIDTNTKGDTGFITNNYGLYIGNQADGSTLNYSIYTNTGAVRLGDDTYWEGSGSGLPYASMYVKDNTSAQSITNGSFVKITAFSTNGNSNILVPDATNDYITVPKTGKYLCTVAGVAGGDSSVIWDLDVGTSTSSIFNNVHTHHNFTGITERQTFSMIGIVSLSANDNVSVYVSHDGLSAKDILFEDMTLELTMIGG